MTKRLVVLAMGTLMPAATLVGMACSSNNGGPTPYVPGDAMTMMMTGNDTGTLSDITLPEAPSGFFDSQSFVDGGLGLESGFGLDASDAADAPFFFDASTSDADAGF